MQQVTRAKSARNKFFLTKSIRNKLHEENQLYEEKINEKFHEQKSARSNFKEQNNQHTMGSRNKNQ